MTLEVGIHRLPVGVRVMWGEEGPYMGDGPHIGHPCL